MAARTQGQTPGLPGALPSGGAGEGASIVGENLPANNLPPLPGIKPEDWAKLPRKLAEGLIEAQRENTSAEYRAQIEAYFRLIAERLQKNKKP
jgi:hypothetical protein